MKRKLAHTNSHTLLLQSCLYQRLLLSDYTAKFTEGNIVPLVSEIEKTYAGTLQWFVELLHFYSELHTLTISEVIFFSKRTQ